MSITQEHLGTVCKIGQGADCCRYLTFGNGFECEKLGSLRAHIDQRVAHMVAQADNCDGIAP